MSPLQDATQVIAGASFDNGMFLLSLGAFTDFVTSLPDNEKEWVVSEALRLIVGSAQMNDLSLVRYLTKAVLTANAAHTQDGAAASAMVQMDKTFEELSLSPTALTMSPRVTPQVVTGVPPSPHAYLGVRGASFVTPTLFLADGGTEEEGTGSVKGAICDTNKEVSSADADENRNRADKTGTTGKLGDTDEDCRPAMTLTTKRKLEHANIDATVGTMIDSYGPGLSHPISYARASVTETHVRLEDALDLEGVLSGQQLSMKHVKPAKIRRKTARNGLPRVPSDAM